MFRIGLSLFLIDQVTKFFAIHAKSVEFNAGIAFGFGQHNLGDSGATIWILLPVILVLLLDFSRRRINLSDVAILSGGISNLFDRIYWKSVVDWIRLGTLWFNLADIYIVLGFAWIILKKIREIRKLRKPENLTTS